MPCARVYISFYLLFRRIRHISNGNKTRSNKPNGLLYIITNDKTSDIFLDNEREAIFFFSHAHGILAFFVSKLNCCIRILFMVGLRFCIFTLSKKITSSFESIFAFLCDRILMANRKIRLKFQTTLLMNIPIECN